MTDPPRDSLADRSVCFVIGPDESRARIPARLEQRLRHCRAAWKRSHIPARGLIIGAVPEHQNDVRLTPIDSQPLRVEVSGHPVQNVRVHVAHLRRKLDAAGARSIIVTEPGVGYRCEVPLAHSV